MLARVRKTYEKILEAILIVLMVALAVEVTVGVVFRYVGYALVWYDEIATILLAWVTYYGSALAALKRSHLGVPEIVAMMPPTTQLCVSRGPTASSTTTAGRGAAASASYRCNAPWRDLGPPGVVVSTVAVTA